jgi:phosphoribosylformimino-5-aminoimidazole carboxamide ribotide isomerase
MIDFERRVPMSSCALPRIVPVIDLLRGLVVRGVAGRRCEYQPLTSPLCGDAQPATLARAFYEHGFREVYLADLDAIGGAAPAWEIYRQVAECGLRMWVDAGLSTIDRAVELMKFTTSQGPLAGVVAGLESLAGPDLLAEMLAVVGPPRLIFSLDLKGGQPLTEATAWQGLDAREVAQVALDCGVRRMIVLDLARVGMNGGLGTEGLCRRLRDLTPELEITAGGGVRNQADLQSLAAAGCDAALVASALHDGRITTTSARAFP